MTPETLSDSAARTLGVVVVEDNPILLDTLCAALEDFGITVLGRASDGADALEIVRRERPDVVLMDMRMPKLDGIEATRRITEADAGQAVVILSAFDDVQMIESARLAGARACLKKGIALPDLVREIRLARGPQH